MKIKNMILPVLVAASLSSCETWSDASSVRTAEAEIGLLVQPMVIEIDSVSTQMIVDTISFTDKTYQEKDKPSLCKEALVRCKLKYKFDLLVNPSYQIYSDTSKKSKNTRRSSYYQVVVSGFPAYYKRIRPATPDDSWMIPFYNRTAHIEMNSIQQNAQSVIK